MSRPFSVRPIEPRRIFAAGRAVATIIALTTAVESSALSAQTSPRGLWELQYDQEKARVHLNFEHYEDGRRHGGMTGFTVMPSQITGVTQSQLVSGEGPVRFQLARDAGTFNFEGQLYRGRGNGSFTFAPNPQFIGELAKRGYGRPSAEQQFQLGLHDMGYAIVDELRVQGYNRPSVEDLVTLGHHGVRFDYVRGLGSLGYRVGTTDRLQELRDHGVTPAFITGLASSGYAKLSIDRLLELRDHGVTPAFISGMAQAGYGKLSAEELLELRDHGVTVAFAERVREREGSLSVEELIRRRDQGYRY